MKKVAVLASCLGFLLSSAIHAKTTLPEIHLVRVPDGSIQPQTVVDKQGTVHLVYFKGDPAAGDLFYARSSNGLYFSTPIRVNSVLGSAIAIGNIRGARIAIGRRGRVYIAWNGSRKVSSPDGHAWETEKRINFGRISPATATVTDLNLPDAGIDQKYPSLAMNRAGLVLVSWTEGMGWKRGGSLHWQLFNPSLHPVDKPGSATGVPVWSLVAAYSLADGGFGILY